MNAGPTSFLSTGPHVIIATSASAACAASADGGGVPPGGNGAILSMMVPAMAAGTFAIGASHITSEPMVSKDGGVAVLVPGASAAQLTVWKNGSLAVDSQYATSGSVEVNVSDPIGGLMGSYDLIFGADVEQGTFIAPACDPCTGPFKTPHP